MTLRDAISDDLASIHALELATPEAAHWSRETYSTILSVKDGANLHRRILVALREDTITGFLVLSLLRLPEGIEAEIENIAVAANARRQGIGSALCAAAVQAAAAANVAFIDLEVRASNQAAVALYFAQGFAHLTTRAGYYSSPVEDALVLRLHLHS